MTAPRRIAAVAAAGVLLAAAGIQAQVACWKSSMGFTTVREGSCTTTYEVSTIECADGTSYVVYDHQGSECFFA